MTLARAIEIAEEIATTAAEAEGTWIKRTLREANITRQSEWDTGGNIDLSYAGNEFAGEVSEAITEAVLMLSDAGNASDLADELGDVVICTDLIALNAGIDAIVHHDMVTVHQSDTQTWINEIGSDLMGVCNTIKKLERERHGMPGSRATLDDLEDGLRIVVIDAYAIAGCFGINLNSAVAAKFNKTSEKVGLKTRYIP